MLQTCVCKCFTCFRCMLQKCFHIVILVGVESGCMQMRPHERSGPPYTVSEASVSHVNRHVVRSPPTCASKDMWRAAAYVRARCVGVAVACACGNGRASAIVASGADANPFLLKWSAFAWKPYIRRKNYCHFCRCIQ
jgi:hypothetical protein